MLVTLMKMPSELLDFSLPLFLVGFFFPFVCVCPKFGLLLCGFRLFPSFEGEERSSKKKGYVAESSRLLLESVA